jgi:hypothetical protein
MSDITVTLEPLEVLVIAVALAAVPQGPPQVEAAIASAARKMVDAQDLAMIPTI